MQLIEEYLRSGADQEIITKHNNPAKWVVSVVVGVMMLMYSYEVPMSDSLQMVLLVAGFTLATIGLVMSVVSSRGVHYVFKPNGSVLKERKRYIADGDRANVQEMLTSRKLDALKPLKPRVTSNTLLKAFQSSDGEVVAVQLMFYEGSMLHPLTVPVVLKGEQAGNATAFLNNKVEE